MITNKKRLSILGAASTLIVAPSCAKQAETQTPNIIYILADDLGYGDLGCYGQQLIRTPHIDRMAEQGIRFTQHYAGCTVSAPSRSVLMTGLHTGHTYIRGNKGYGQEGQLPLPKSTITIAHVLQDAGYATGAFGKWGLGAPGTSGDPNMQGFDEFYGFNCQRIAHNYYPPHLWHNQEKIMLPGNEGTKMEQYSQDMIHEEAMDFIRENKDGKFFAFLPYILPHAELIVPKDELLTQYEGTMDPGKPYVGVDDPKSETYKNGAYGSSATPYYTHAAMVSRLDAYVGEIIVMLEELGIAHNTIVMFTSDNGPHREGGANPAYFNSNGGLRGVKRDLYEGGIRVPFIAYWPGQIKAGQTTEHISAFWDIMPTMAQMAGVAAPKNTDGISIVPTLLGQGEQAQHEYLYWEFHEQGGRLAVRMGDWKGIKLNHGKNPNSPIKLYNLATDLKETTNVADENPDVVAKIAEIMKTARTESDEFNFGSKTVIQ